MTDPQYVNNLSDIYTEMYNTAGIERPLTEQQIKRVDKEEEHDYDVPKWKRLLNQHAAGEKFKQPPYIGHVEGREDPEENEEENEKASLAIKLVLELIGDAQHDEAAANALYMIRDLVK
jgi:hypothetical protein|tara:strand:+ start:2176 stop:2532 length:357 start_codon:yes stop_codon:yes gene_type:complete